MSYRPNSAIYIEFFEHLYNKDNVSMFHSAIMSPCFMPYHIRRKTRCRTFLRGSKELLVRSSCVLIKGIAIYRKERSFRGRRNVHHYHHHHHPGEGLKSRLECRKPCVKSVQPNKRIVCAGLKLFTSVSSPSGMM